MKLMEDALMASADSAAYYDRSLEESAETLQSFLKGNFANDAALGVSCTEFTRNAKAVELFGKNYNDLSEVQKQQTLLKMVTDSQKLSGAMGQASREADGWENVQGNLNESWRQFMSEVGQPVLESLIPIIQELTEKFQEWMKSEEGQEFIENFGTALSTALEVAGNVVSFIVNNKEVVLAILAVITAAFIALNTRC